MDEERHTQFLPMRLSISLASYLQGPVPKSATLDKYERGPCLTNEVMEADKAQDLSGSIHTLSLLLRLFFDHPDWSQLYNFFKTRYSSERHQDDVAARQLRPPANTQLVSAVTVWFRTDTGSVGLPPDLYAQLSQAGKGLGVHTRSDRGEMAIASAISMAIGGAAYMDLLYAQHPPGDRAAISKLSIDLARKNGGRGRSPGEWAELWNVISEWVYQYDVAGIQAGFHWHPQGLDAIYKRRRTCLDDPGSDDYFVADAVDAADGIRDVFFKLGSEPFCYQGREWEFIKLQLEGRAREMFFSRFVVSAKCDHERLEDLVRTVEGSRWGSAEATREGAKPCPSSFRGADWETWLLSIEGGNVVVVDTQFQALWAAMLLAQLPLTLVTLKTDEGIPQIRDPMKVYVW